MLAPRWTRRFVTHGGLHARSRFSLARVRRGLLVVPPDGAGAASGLVLAELGLLLALGLGYLCWQEGSRWYAVGAGLALLGSLLLVVVRHNYDWWLFKLGPRGRLYIPFD